MNKLSDTQLVVLSAACQRLDRNLLPLPPSLKGGAQGKVVASLIGKGLVNEIGAQPGQLVWRESEDGTRTTLRATDAAFQALGIEAEPGASGMGGEQPDATQPTEPGGQGNTAAPTASGGDEPHGKAAEPDGDSIAAATPAEGRVRKARDNSKQAQLVALLQQPEGASLDQIIAATGWQAHTVRGAIAGALKKKLGLTVRSEKINGRGRVYRIVAGGSV